MIKLQKTPRTDLPWLVTLHMIAFLGFHATVEFNGTIWFRRLTFDQNDFLGALVGVWGFWLWTLGFAIYFAFLFVVCAKNRAFTFASSVAAYYSFTMYRYPIATTILVLFDQFERIGYLVYHQNAGLDQVLGIK